MEPIKALNVGIVGGGPGCKAIMDMIFAEKLSGLRMKLIGVADLNSEAVGYRYAQEKQIYTTKNYRDLYKLKGLDMIIELTGLDGVADEISRTRPAHVRIIDHVAAHLFWDIFQIEEEKIAERKQVEEALRSAHRKLRASFDAIQDIMLIVDLDFNLTDMNDVPIKVFSLPDKESALGRKCFEVLKGRKEICLSCAVAEAYRTKRAAYRTSISEDEVSTGGRSFEIFAYPIMDKQGNISGAVEFARDITERRQAEEALRKAHEELERRVEERTAELEIRNKLLELEIAERKQAEAALRHSEQKFRDLTEATTDWVWEVDAQGVYTYASPKVKDLLGYEVREVVGLTPFDFLPEEEAEKIRQFFNQKVINKEPFYGLENVNRHKDGHLVVLETNGIPIFDKKGQLKGYRGIDRNITKRKRAEEEKKKLEAQLQQAHKMEAIGTLAGGIAHDFNNLLMGIQGNVSLTLLEIDPLHPHYQRLKSIEKQVQSGVKLTGQLLGYARKGKYEVKPINLNQLVEGTSDVFGRTRRGITIQQELAEDLLAIEADQGQIEQVLWNLYVNAADAMSTCADGAAGSPGGGKLILKTMNVTHKDMKGELYDPKPGNYVLLTVTDTGAGMDKKTMERIFDPFFTTKEMGRGTGLGLASAYGIIKGHRGYIEVDSEKGKGATFRIYLPASEEKVRKVIKTGEGFIEGPGTILLVDDEEIILEVAGDLLEAIGYRVLTAKDGKEAIKVYKKNRDEIDLVLLDTVMPNMGGGETYDCLKEINPDIKVLLSSGYSIDGEAREILARGCNGFIQKPFTMKELSGKMREVLERE